jgi:hypothetical protein
VLAGSGGKAAKLTFAKQQMMVGARGLCWGRAVTRQGGVMGSGRGGELEVAKWSSGKVHGGARWIRRALRLGEGGEEVAKWLSGKVHGGARWIRRALRLGEGGEEVAEWLSGRGEVAEWLSGRVHGRARWGRGALRVAARSWCAGRGARWRVLG